MLIILFNSPTIDLAICPPWFSLSSTPLATDCEASGLAQLSLFQTPSSPVIPLLHGELLPDSSHYRAQLPAWQLLGSPCRNLSTLPWITPSITSSRVFYLPPAADRHSGQPPTPKPSRTKHQNQRELRKRLPPTAKQTQSRYPEKSRGAVPPPLKQTLTMPNLTQSTSSH